MISPTRLPMNIVTRDGEHWGQLDECISFVVGGDAVAQFNNGEFSCEIAWGTLTVNKGSVWDFGSWAMDTPDMQMASLMHDAFCHMHEAGLISGKERMRGDRLFYRVLKEHGCPLPRRVWCYLAVAAYTLTRILWRTE